MAQAKRIILRISEADLNHQDLHEAVRVYLRAKNRPVDELTQHRHFIHIQPPSPDIPQEDPKIHIVIDLEKDLHSGSGPLGPEFPHELYRIRRVDGEMKLGEFRDGLWYKNFLAKVRQFTDELYPWGCTTHDLRVAQGTANVSRLEGC